MNYHRLPPGHSRSVSSLEGPAGTEFAQIAE